MEFGKKYGYARVSSKGQNLDAQLKQLHEAGVPDKDIFKEKVSGRKKDNREEFNKLLELVKEKDTIVVTKLDRFARSTLDALSTIKYLTDKKVGLVILNLGGQAVDTTSGHGKFMITMLSGVAELEADINRERQTEGIALAKERGIYKGRPKRYTENHPYLKEALNDYNNRDINGLTVKQIAEHRGISKATLYRAVREQQSKIKDD